MHVCSVTSLIFYECWFVTKKKKKNYNSLYVLQAVDIWFFVYLLFYVDDMFIKYIF
jgi:hypothetical protein